MQSLYSNEIRAFVRSRNWPKTLRWEIVEFEDCLKLRLYRENINSLTGEEKLATASIVNTVLTSIQKDGIPIYTWVEKGDGSDARIRDGLAH